MINTTLSRVLINGLGLSLCDNPYASIRISLSVLVKARITLCIAYVLRRCLVFLLCRNTFKSFVTKKIGHINMVFGLE